MKSPWHLIGIVLATVTIAYPVYSLVSTQPGSTAEPAGQSAPAPQASATSVVRQSGATSAATPAAAARPPVSPDPQEESHWRRYFPAAQMIASETNASQGADRHVYLLETPGKHRWIRVIHEPSAGPESAGMTAMVANQVLVRANPETDDALLQQAVLTVGGTLQARRLASGHRVVELPHHATLAEFEKAMEDLRHLSAEVATVEPDYLRFPTEVPNDPRLSSQWALSTIDAFTAWDLTTATGNSVVVAVIDSGVDVNHPDLAGQLWMNPAEVAGNGIDDDQNGRIDDVHGWNFAAETAVLSDTFNHGTSVAGIIAAKQNNGIGIAGIAKNAKVMVLKNGDSSSAVSDSIEAVYYAVQKGARIINMSYGGKNFSQAEADAITYAHNAGAVLIASAGNTGSSLYTAYPANLSEVISVAATTAADQLASFSSYGLFTDISAPGENLYTLSGNGSGGFRYFTGTSAAAPVVSGIVALMLQQHPAFTPQEVRSILQSTAHDVGEPGWDSRTAYGRINAAAAVAEASGIEMMISAPGMGTTVTRTAEITGTVRGTGLTQWTLEYGLGESAASFTPIATRTGAVTNGLLASWDTATVPDGRYTLRIRAINAAGRVFTQRLVVDVGNSFAKVAPGWPSSQLALSEKCVADMDGDGISEIIGTGGYCDASIVRGNATYMPGWPKTFYPGETRISMAAAGDVDGDGRPEVVFITRWASWSTYATVRVYRRDGTALPGWPKMLDRGITLASGSQTLEFPVLADLDRDGALEIIIMSSTAEYTGEAIVHVFKGNGSELPGWPVTLWPGSVGSAGALAVGDFDSDGSLDIAGTTADSKVFVLHRDGTLMNGWPVELGTPWNEGGTVAFADFDHDGNLDLFAGVHSGHIAIYNRSGQLAPGWPKKMAENARLPAIADLDGNGDLEIAIASVNTLVGGQRLLYVWHHDGVIASGYPRSETNMSDPIILDFDGNGSFDVIASSYHYSYAFDLRGQSVFAFGLPRAGGRASNIVAGDFLGDGTVDLLLVEDYFPFSYALLNYRASSAAARMPWPQQALSAQKNARLVRARLGEFNGQQLVARGAGASPVALAASDWLVGSKVTVGGVLCSVDETVDGLKITLGASVPLGVQDVVVDNANAGTFAFPRALCVVDSATADQDGDGMPNEWEWSHGLNLFDAAAANGGSADGDRDGRPALLEYVLGSDPNHADAGDAYSVSTTSDGVYFTCQVRAGLLTANCYPEWTASLTPAAWSNDALTLVGETTHDQAPGTVRRTYRLAGPGSSAFFRLVAKPVP